MNEKAEPVVLCRVCPRQRRADPSPEVAFELRLQGRELAVESWGQALRERRQEAWMQASEPGSHGQAGESWKAHLEGVAAHP